MKRSPLLSAWWFGALLLLALSASSGPALAQPAVAAAAASDFHTVLVLPFDNGAGTAGSGPAAELAEAVKLRLNAVGIYQATAYSVHLPAIQRALNVDNTLAPDDVRMPVTDPTQGQRIARICDTGGYLLGEVESLVTDSTTGTVRLTVSAELYSTQTGEAVKTVAITGIAAASSRSEDPASVLDRAVQDAAGKVASALTNGVQPVQAASLPSSSVQGGSKGHAGVAAILLVALAGAVAALAFHSSGSSGSSSGGGGGTSGGGGSSGPPGFPTF